MTIGVQLHWRTLLYYIPVSLDNNNNKVKVWQRGAGASWAQQQKRTKRLKGRSSGAGTRPGQLCAGCGQLQRGTRRIATHPSNINGHGRGQPGLGAIYKK